MVSRLSCWFAPIIFTPSLLSGHVLHSRALKVSLEAPSEIRRRTRRRPHRHKKKETKEGAPGTLELATGEDGTQMLRSRLARHFNKAVSAPSADMAPLLGDGDF